MLLPDLQRWAVLRDGLLLWRVRAGVCLPVKDTLNAAYWLLAMLALGLGLWFWGEVAVAAVKAFRREPRASFVTLAKILGAFAAMILVLWIVTAGDRP